MEVRKLTKHMKEHPEVQRYAVVDHLPAAASDTPRI